MPIKLTHSASSGGTNLDQTRSYGYLWDFAINGGVSGFLTYHKDSKHFLELTDFSTSLSHGEEKEQFSLGFAAPVKAINTGNSEQTEFTIKYRPYQGQTVANPINLLAGKSLTETTTDLQYDDQSERGIGYTVSNLKAVYERKAEKHICLISPFFLTKLSRGRRWQLIDGVPYWVQRKRSGKVRKQRIDHPDLPSVDIPVTDVQVWFCYNHHEIVRLIATMYLGVRTVRINTPNLALNRSLKIDIGKTFMETLKKLTDVWEPTIILRPVVVNEDGESDDDYPVCDLDIIDYASKDKKSGPQKIRFSPLANIISGSLTRTADFDKSVDQVIIKGGKILSTNETPDPGNLEAVRLEPLELDPRQVLIFSHMESFSAGMGAKTMGDYTGGFNEEDAPPQKRPESVWKTEKYYQDEFDPSKLVLIGEKTETYSGNELIHSISVSHQYGEGYQVIRSFESEGMLVQEPGIPYKKFRTVLTRIIDQSILIDGMQRANTTEITEEPVVVTEVTPASGNTYYSGAVRLIQAQTQNRVEKRPNTRQKLIEMTSKMKQAKLHRVTPGLLRQIEAEWDNVSETMHVQSQVITDPRKNWDIPENQFIKVISRPEVTMVRNVVEVDVPDCVDDLTAQDIADRIFARSDGTGSDVSLSMHCLFMPTMVGVVGAVDLPQVEKNSAIAGGGSDGKKVVDDGKKVVDLSENGESRRNFFLESAEWGFRSGSTHADNDVFSNVKLRRL
jgi:hypothetical protein